MSPLLSAHITMSTGFSDWDALERQKVAVIGRINPAKKRRSY